MLDALRNPRRERRRRVSASAWLGVALLSGCGPSTESHDAYLRVEYPPPAGVSVSFVVQRPQSPGVEAESVPGLDLDGRVGLGGPDCTDALDHVSSFDGSEGIDNQLPTGIELDIEALSGVPPLAATLPLFLGVRVNDINSFANDASVTLDLVALAPECPACMAGEAPAGQHWIQTEALATGLSGHIADGVIDVGPLDLATTPLVRDVALRGHVSRDALDLVLGGHVRVTDWTAAAEAARPGSGEAVRAATGARADLRQGADGECDAISIGLAFVGVPGSF